MTTERKLLVGGGVLVGALILYEIFKSSTSTPARRPSGISAALTAAGTFVGGLISAFGGANAPTPSGATGVGSGSQFWSSPSAAAANGYNPYVVSTPTGGYTAGAAPNYAYADANPGTPLPSGVYGPPVPLPASGLVSPGGGDYTSLADANQIPVGSD